MRPVAALVALLALLVLPSVASGDDCVFPCVAVPAESVPNTGQQIEPGYYVYLQVVTCAPAMKDACMGRPTEGAPLGYVGMVYQETNHRAGLQRTSTVSGSTTIPPDQTLLL